QPALGVRRGGRGARRGEEDRQGADRRTGPAEDRRGDSKGDDRAEGLSGAAPCRWPGGHHHDHHTGHEERRSSLRELFVVVMREARSQSRSLKSAGITTASGVTLALTLSTSDVIVMIAVRPLPLLSSSDFFRRIIRRAIMPP